MTKRLLALALAWVLVLGLCPAAGAVSLKADEVFLKQQTRTTCTLASATMLLRRKALVDGDVNWASITESAVRKVAWTGGLAYNFTYNGIHVSIMHKGTWGGNTVEGKKAFLIQYLQDHPEGVVVYNRSRPHAVLLTDYDAATDTFYCCDPAKGYPEGRIPLAQCYNHGTGQDGKIKNLDQLWYVASGVSNGAGTAEVADELRPAQPEQEPLPEFENVKGLACSMPIDVDGQSVEMPMYILPDAQGNDVNYIRVRDLAAALSGAQARFNVGYDQDVLLTTNEPYQFDGSEMVSPLQGEMTYGLPTTLTRVNGAVTALDAVQLTDTQGGGHTYYKLRDLARVLDIHVDWDAQEGIRIDTAQPYNG